MAWDIIKFDKEINDECIKQGFKGMNKKCICKETGKTCNGLITGLGLGCQIMC